ncbi:transporter substrate-binding domain-containing protein [Lacimicrobium sp. SS2-24]|uniref:substrate-binding periplasmic protein n=1 Tax=Lacimicrobium sp. SS2-24 TaxID=2005569 RepID=UPI000B4B30BA|nr:transporter substrate-binding domain-containing protein [Lacimicrobium sp. SS2-24]
MLFIKFILTSAILFSATVTAAESYNFASINQLAEQEVGRIVLPQLYAKLNIKVNIRPLPGKRAEYHAVSGQLDGEIMRIYSYGEENPTMLRVPTPYYYLETMPFVLAHRQLKIGHREDLLRFTLGKVRGVKHTNNMTKGMDNVHDFDSTLEMMRMLQGGYIDVALTNTLDGKLTLRRKNITSVKATEVALDRLPLYHYIHHKHEDLVSRINGVMAKSKASGELEKLIAEAERQVIARVTELKTK